MDGLWNTYSKLIVYTLVVDTSTKQTTIYQSDGVTEVLRAAGDQSYWQAAANPVTIGYKDIGGGRIFNFYGMCGEILVYNLALSATTTPRRADVAADLRAKWRIT